MAGLKHRFGGDALFVAGVLVASIVLRLIWLAGTPFGPTGFAGGGRRRGWR